MNGGREIHTNWLKKGAGPNFVVIIPGCNDLSSHTLPSFMNNTYSKRKIYMRKCLQKIQ